MANPGQPGGLIPPKDFAARVLKRVLRRERERSGDESRFDVAAAVAVEYHLVPFTCWKCSRADYIADLALEPYHARGLRPCCLPCQSPERWKWVTDPENGHVYILPLRPSARSQRVGEREAYLLETAHHELVEKRLRREYLLELRASVEQELAGLVSRVAELEGEIPRLQDELVAVQTSPTRGVAQRLLDERAELARLEAKYAEMTGGKRVTG